MPALDTACLAILVLAAVAGAFRGAFAQLVRLGAIAAGWAAARWGGPALAPALQGGVPPFAAHPIAAVLCFLAGTLAARIVLGTLAAAASRRDQARGPDRGLGALLGAAQAGLVLWVVLSALVVWNQPLRIGRFAIDPHGSELAELAGRHSALGGLRLQRQGQDRGERTIQPRSL